MRTKTISIIASLILASALTGCASQANKDPLEGFNRGVYKFNDTADKAVIRPVAGAYKAVVPSPVRAGVGNFFSNLGTFVSAINNLLQFKLDNAMSEAGRFVINSTFGVAGLIDVASKDGIQRHPEDFGQTLGHWGYKNSAYLVLPFLGPSTVRDTGGLVVDTIAFDPVSYVDHVPTRNSARLLFFVDKRSQYLPASDLLDDAALDPYAFMRDAFLQRRANQIEDNVASGATTEDDDDYLPDPAPGTESKSDSK